MKGKIFTTLLFIFTLLVLTVLILPEIKRTGPNAGSVESWDEYMKGRVPELMKTQDVPGLIIALISEGETVWIDAYGFADLEKSIPMIENTICRVESISKSVTAWGVMKLVEEEKIDLDKPVEAYLKNWSLPESPFSEEKITLRHLLSQTSGLPLGTIGVRYDPEGDLPSLKDVLKGEVILFQDPGTSFSYSNAGYNLLELLIEEVRGISFAEYMSVEILSPLGMDNSSFVWNSKWEPNVPKGYSSRGEPIPVYVYPDKASGGLFSTASDVAAFVSAGMTGYTAPEGHLLSHNSIRTLYHSWSHPRGYYSLIYDGYGFGHFIEKLSNETLVVSHGGQGSGWMTQFYSVPETGDGLVMLSNSQRSWPLFSNLLLEWSRWNGLPPVGMGLIKRSALILRIFMVLCLEFLLIVLIRTILSLRDNRRQFFLKNPVIRFRQITQFSLAIALTATVTGINQMKYFFLNSVFPVETPLLGGLIISTAALLAFLAIVPVNPKMNS